MIFFKVIDDSDDFYLELDINYFKMLINILIIMSES